MVAEKYVSQNDIRKLFFANRVVADNCVNSSALDNFRSCISSELKMKT